MWETKPDAFAEINCHADKRCESSDYGPERKRKDQVRDEHDPNGLHIGIGDHISKSLMETFGDFFGERKPPFRVHPDFSFHNIAIIAER